MSVEPMNTPEIAGSEQTGFVVTCSDCGYESQRFEHYNNAAADRDAHGVHNPFTIPLTGPFFSQAARDAATSNYDYAKSVEMHSLHLYVRFAERGDLGRARKMLTRSLGESLQGNDGE